MTRRLRSPLPDHLVSGQRSAADPTASVWVRANAGSGKTHVLTQRVQRLLLAGAAPETILCLTYTKAAAAEMRRRVAERLGDWAVLEEAKLIAELTELEGAPPSPAQLRRARTLFAHALETPGGLKIVTIHAFCESVLHRFPLEAGVPFDFVVLEDHERAEMVLRAREAVLSGGLKGDPAVALAVESLFELLSDHALNESIANALAQARTLRPVLADRAKARDRLRALVGYDPADTRDAILAEAADASLLTPADIADLFVAMPPVPGRSVRQTLTDKLWANRMRPERGAVLLSAFLKDNGDPYSDRRRHKSFRGPLNDLVGDEHDRLAALYVRLKRAELLERSEAMLDVLGAIADRYEAEKRARSLLDFDDLIGRTVALFKNPALGEWVRYKLDAGIDHILVDESQDTNPEQWAAVKALADEFFTGDSAVTRPRTIFAVGDVKQSIYSFQGADPQQFIDTGRHYLRLAGGLGLRIDFSERQLHTSFRTLPGILGAVDAVFTTPALRDAALDGAVTHETARADSGGTVTLWAPIKDQGDEPDPANWPLEPQKSYQSAARQVAERIAREIQSWVQGRRPLGPRGRAVGYDDVLILVQNRNALFRELIRALHKEQIPTPGADRLEVTTHIAVLDLLALGDVLLNPGDDLQLAALLRSPLYDLSEGDLFAVANPRQQGERLWDALRTAPGAAARAAYAELAGFRARLDFERPFEFFASVLYQARGLNRFHRRFGREVDDLFAEFLDLALAHEQGAQPSLQGFLSAMRAREVEIKRELGEGGAGVRVMTVHGAKGLEAPIVILADAATKPHGSHLQQQVYLDDGPGGPMLVHASKADTHVPQTMPLKEAYEAAQIREYWRKLYVGMTRAEDELYVTGTLTKKGKVDGTWYEAITEALGANAEPILNAEGEPQSLIYPLDRPDPEPLRAPASQPGPTTSALYAPPRLPPATRIETVRPSSAGATSDPDRALDPALSGLVDAETARREGIALHALLQHLAPIAAIERVGVAARALVELLPDAPDSHARLAAKAIAILGAPLLADIFGPDSRAEVPFMAMVTRNGAPVRLVGRIDRLVVTPGRVRVIDFKSDANAPDSAQTVSASYRTQLGLYALVASQLYPDREIEASILWTGPESLINLPLSHLLAATDGFTMA